MAVRSPMDALAGRHARRDGSPTSVWIGSVSIAPVSTQLPLKVTSRALDAATSVVEVFGWQPLHHPSGALLSPIVGDVVAFEYDAQGEAWCIGWEPDEWPADPGTDPSGPALPQIVTVNTNTTLAAGDVIVLVTGGVTVSLPDTHTAGQSHTVKDAAGSAGSSAIQVQGTGGDTIDGAASTLISTNWAAVQFISNGTNWFRL